MTLPRLDPYDPDDVTDYAIDWSQWLAVGETITAESWTVHPALGAPSFIARGTFADSCTAITLTGGGVPGRDYTFRCQATKSSPTSNKQTFGFVVPIRHI